jgi:hypothetical protein
MAITDIYRKPFRKASLFLYPLLNINKQATIKPESVWTSFDAVIKKEEKKLICIYDTTVNDFEKFAAKVITSRVNFLERIELEDGLHAFVFDFSIYENSWDAYLNGKYSQFDEVSKKKILSYHRSNPANVEYLISFLYPEKYFDTYARILNVDVNLLVHVGELCDKPNLESEKLVSNSYCILCASQLSSN